MLVASLCWCLVVFPDDFALLQLLQLDLGVLLLHGQRSYLHPADRLWIVGTLTVVQHWYQTLDVSRLVLASRLL